MPYDITVVRSTDTALARDANERTVAEAENAGRDLFDRTTAGIERAVLRFLDREVHRERSITVGEINAGDHHGLALKLQAKIIASDDALLTGDPHLKETAARLSAAEQPFTWVMLGGGIFPRTGFGGSIPIAGSVSAYVGFAADAAITYSVLAPYAHEPASVLEAVKNATVDLPLTAKLARELDEGTTVLLQGRGRVAVSTGVNAGSTIARIGHFADIGAHAGIRFVVSGELDLSLKVKRLPGDEVLVTLSRIDTTGGTVSFGAGIGVDSHLHEALGEVDRALEKWLRVDLRLAHSLSETGTEIASYRIDLSNPAAARTYERLLRLDTRFADRLAVEGGGVRSARLSEHAESSPTSLRVNLGKFKILDFIADSREAHGTLSTPDGDIRYHRIDLARGYSDVLTYLFAGRQNIQRQYVSARHPGEASASGYYRVRYQVKDPLTTRWDIRRFFTLADIIGALDDRTREVLANRSFAKSFAGTERILDVYVTDAGLKRLAEASEEQLHDAFAAVHERFDGDHDARAWRVAPWVNRTHPDYAEAMRLLEAWQRNTADEEKKQDLTARYRVITGRDLRSDSDGYGEAKALVSLFAELPEAATPEARARVFARIDQLNGLDFWRELATIATLTGPEEVLVNELSIKEAETNRRIHLMKEGAVTDPGDAIRRIIADP